MTVNLIENLKNIWKSGGWCPKKAFEGLPQNFPEETTSATVANSGPGIIGTVFEWGVPVQFTGDLRLIAVILPSLLLFMGLSLYDHLYRSFASYLSVVLGAFLLAAPLFLFNCKSLTIDAENISIRTPLLRPLHFPKEELKVVRSKENSNYKHKKLNYALFIFALIIVTFSFLIPHLPLSLTSIRLILIHSLDFETAPNIGMKLFIYLCQFYIFSAHQRMARYPKKLEAIFENRKFSLYPRNDIEYYALKEKLTQIQLNRSS